MFNGGDQGYFLGKWIYNNIRWSSIWCSGRNSGRIPRCEYQSWVQSFVLTINRLWMSIYLLEDDIDKTFSLLSSYLLVIYKSFSILCLVDVVFSPVNHYCVWLSCCNNWRCPFLFLLYLLSVLLAYTFSFLLFVTYQLSFYLILSRLRSDHVVLLGYLDFAVGTH